MSGKELREAVEAAWHDVQVSRVKLECLVHASVTADIISRVKLKQARADYEAARADYEAAQFRHAAIEDEFRRSVRLLRDRANRDVSAMPEIAALAEAAREAKDRYTSERNRLVCEVHERLQREAGLLP